MAIKNLLFPFSLIGAFGLTTLLIFQKFLQLSIGHTVYYCQNVIKSLSLQFPQPLGIVLISLLLLTIVFPLLKFLFNLHKLSRLKNNLTPSLEMSKKLFRLVTALDLQGKVIQVKSRKLFAYCVGMKSPKIYVSSALISSVDSRELEAILLHEKSHLDNHDPFVLVLMSIVHSLFPYLPILSDFVRNFRIEREIQADQAAVYQQGEMKPLLSAMRKLLLIEDSDRFAFSLGMGELDTLEVRINMLLNKKLIHKKFHALNIIATTVTILVVGFMAIAPVHAIENHENGKDVMTVWCDGNQTINSSQPSENSSHPYSTK